MPAGAPAGACWAAGAVAAKAAPHWLQNLALPTLLPHDGQNIFNNLLQVLALIILLNIILYRQANRLHNHPIIFKRLQKQPAASVIIVRLLAAQYNGTVQSTNQKIRRQKDRFQRRQRLSFFISYGWG